MRVSGGRESVSFTRHFFLPFRNVLDRPALLQEAGKLAHADRIENRIQERFKESQRLPGQTTKRRGRIEHQLRWQRHRPPSDLSANRINRGYL